MIDRREEFKSELNELLKKYRCDIYASDEWEGYPECGEDIQIRVEFDYNTNIGDEYLEDLKFGTSFYRQ